MKIVFAFIFFLVAHSLAAQIACPPFWSEIVAFKKKDAATPPPPHAILFVGSSSFAKWTDVQDYFPGYPIINRGFGGSSLPDVIRYAQDVILPYQPRQVVIYCGDNDLASSDSITANDVVQRFKTLFAIIRQNLPNTVIDFISIKPSPSRARLMPKMEAANAQIQRFLKRQRHAGFINVYSAMLGADAQPKAELFLDDQLHMKPVGYQLWQKIIQPYLVK